MLRPLRLTVCRNNKGGQEASLFYCVFGIGIGIAIGTRGWDSGRITDALKTDGDTDTDADLWGGQDSNRLICLMRTIA